MAQLTLRKPGSIRHWLRLYRLYLSAFPAAERKPFSVIVRMYRAGKTDVWCICRDNHVVGMVSTVNGRDQVLLDYFAVDSTCRNQRIGSEALAMVQQIYARQGLFVEIESTREDGPNHAERLRRKQFYIRGGMEPLGVFAEVFGVRMELLGSRCRMEFEDYRSFYEVYYSSWAAKHILPDTAESIAEKTEKSVDSLRNF